MVVVEEVLLAQGEPPDPPRRALQQPVRLALHIVTLAASAGGGHVVGAGAVVAPALQQGEGRVVAHLGGGGVVQLAAVHPGQVQVVVAAVLALLAAPAPVLGQGQRCGRGGGHGGGGGVSRGGGSSTSSGGLGLSGAAAAVAPFVVTWLVPGTMAVAVVASETTGEQSVQKSLLW